MSNKIDADLLRACASVLVHSVVYSSIEPLRTDARRVVAGRGWPDPRGVGGSPPDALCDAMTEEHMDSISDYARSHKLRLHDVARAILDAPPSVLAWWCEELDR